jgi:hypothetical protein
MNSSTLGKVYIVGIEPFTTSRRTKRAPDAGDSAHIPNSFTRLSLFLAGRLRRPRPSAGNAIRWHAPYKTVKLGKSYEKLL